MSKYVHIIIIFLVAATLMAGCLGGQDSQDDTDTLFQTSTIDALLEGVYDGDMDFETLLSHGDFGIGTVQTLDGEMVLLDGVAYQVRTDGVAYVIQESELTPFAAVTTYGEDISAVLTEGMDMTDTATYIESLLPSKNISYAIRIEGTFSQMTTRSVPAQTAPYPPLLDVVKDQTVFDLGETTGTIVGFWMPYYVDGINVPSFHLHYISDDRSTGGHILGFTIADAALGLDDTYDLVIDLIKTDEYLDAPLGDDSGDDLEHVEKS